MERRRRHPPHHPFLEKMECTLLTGHRVVPPFRLAGGKNGQIGQNSVRQLDGWIEKLKGCERPRSTPVRR